MSTQIQQGGMTYISTAEAADLTGYSQDYIGQLARGEKVPSTKVGRLRFVERDSLLAYAGKSDSSSTAVGSSASASESSAETADSVTSADTAHSSNRISSRWRLFRDNKKTTSKTSRSKTTSFIPAVALSLALAVIGLAGFVSADKFARSSESNFENTQSASSGVVEDIPAQESLLAAAVSSSASSVGRAWRATRMLGETVTRPISRTVQDALGFGAQTFSRIGGFVIADQSDRTASPAAPVNNTDSVSENTGSDNAAENVTSVDQPSVNSLDVNQGAATAFSATANQRVFVPSAQLSRLVANDRALKEVVQRLALLMNRALRNDEGGSGSAQTTASGVSGDELNERLVELREFVRENDDEVREEAREDEDRDIDEDDFEDDDLSDNELGDIGDVFAGAADSGDLLQYDDGNWLTVEPSSLGISGGGGTANTAGADGAVQFNGGGDLAADTTNFFWDDTSDRLGIGTSAPVSTLDVAGGTIANVATPVADQDAATKKYVDDSITAAGGYNDESAQDAAGELVVGNTETLIDVLYDDANGELNFNVESDLAQFDNSAAQFTSQGDNLSIFTNDTGYLTTVDISDDTNLSVGQGLTLTGDMLASILGADVQLSELTFDPIEEGELDTESKLESQLTDVADILTSNDGTLDEDDLTNDPLSALGNVAASGATAGQVLAWDGANWINTTDQNTQRTNEEIEDISGAQVSGNTETLIAVSYQDIDGTIDFVVNDDLSQYDNSTTQFTSQGDNISTFTNDAGYITDAQDDDTTYTAGNALTLSGTTFAVDESAINTSNLNNDAGFLTTVDISNDTNLSAGAGATLTGDSISVDLGTTVDLTELTFDPIEETELDTEGELETQIGTTLVSDAENNDQLDDLSDDTTDDLTEGTVNLYYTDSRVANYLNTNNYLASGNNISELTNDAGYITENDSITLSGDVTGSGTSSITVSLATSSVADNEIDYSAVTVSDFTNDAGYITDAQDDDTTYTAGNGLQLNATEFSIAANVLQEADIDTEAEFESTLFSVVTPGENNDEEDDLSNDPLSALGNVAAAGATVGQILAWDGTNWINATDQNTQRTDEEIEDISGAQVSGNTETLIAVSYQDIDGTIDFVVNDDLSQYDNSTTQFTSAGDNISTFTNDAGYLSTVDISADTNLVAGNLLSLNNDTLDVANAVLVDTEIDTETEFENTLFSVVTPGENNDTADDFSDNTTDDLAEGNANLYFTDTRARGALSGGTGITYNTATGEITNTGVLSFAGRAGAVTPQAGDYTTGQVTEASNLYFTAERVDDRTNELLTAGANTTLTYDDVAGTLTIDTIDTNTQRTEGEVEGFIFDADNTGTLSSGTLALNSLSYTGLLTDSELADDITISAAGAVADGALSPSVSLLGQDIQLGELTFDPIEETELDTETELETQIGTTLVSDAENNDSADDFSDNSTTDLAEGDNLYFTEERVDDRANELLVGGANTTLTYDDIAGTLTIDSADTDTQRSNEEIQDIAGAMTTSNTETLIDVIYQDTNGTIDFVVNNNLAAYDNSQSVFITDANDTVEANELESLFGANGFLKRTGPNSYTADAVVDFAGETNASAGAGIAFSGSTIASVLGADIQLGELTFDPITETELDTEGELETQIGTTLVSDAENNDSADDLSDNSTDDLSEGTVNLYYSDSRVANYLNANNYLASGDNISELTNDVGYITDAEDDDTTYTAGSLLSLSGTTFNVSGDEADFEAALFPVITPSENNDTADDLSDNTTDDLAEGANNLYSPFSESGTDIFYTAGNVGIGTAAPGSALDVAGTTTVDALAAGGDTITDFSGNQLTVTGGVLGLQDGAGSNLDADTIDTLDSTQFLRSDVSDTYTSGTLTFAPATTLNVQGAASFSNDVAITTNGQLVATADSQGTAVGQGPLYINPTSAGVNNVLLGLAVGGDERARIDAEGDVQISGLFNSTQTSGTNSLAGSLFVGGDTTLGTDSGDTVSANGRFNTSIIPDADNAYNLGAPSLRFANVYAATTTIDNLVTGGTASSTFTINRGNNTADAEDGTLAFERGSETPNATLKYNATDKQFEFNGFPVSFENTINVAGTGQSTIAGRLELSGAPGGVGIADSTLYVNPVAAATDNQLFAVGVNGNERFSVDAEGDVRAQASVGIENELYDLTQDTLTIDDDVQINGNDIKDSTGTTRLSLGSTNSITGDLNVGSLTPSRLVTTDGIGTLISEISSANIASSVTDETGTGQLVFSDSPTFSTQATFFGDTITSFTGDNLSVTSGVLNAVDTDTTYTAGNGLQLNATEFSIAANVLQEADIDTEAEFESTLFSVVTPGENNDEEDDLTNDPLSALGNVAASGATAGQVLAWDGANWINTTDQNTQRTNEEIEDISGAQVSGNTETLIAVSYQDIDGTIDFVVNDDLSQYDNSTTQFTSQGDNISVFTNDAGYLSTVDISADTNLVAGVGLTLTDDTLASVLGADVQIGEVTFDPIEETELDTEGELETQLSGLDVFTANDGALADDDLTDDQLSALANVSAAAAASGQVLGYNGANWVPVADENTEYTAGDLLSLSGTTFNVTGDETAFENALFDVVTPAENNDMADDLSNNPISDLGNVAAAGAADGEVFQYNGTDWVSVATSSLGFTDTDTQRTNEEIEDISGAQVSGNTETLIAVTYEDTDGTIDFEVTGDLSQYDNSASQFTSQGDNLSVFTNDVGYITENDSITLSGDATGTGTSSITVSLNTASVSDTEIDYSNVTVSDFTNDAGYITDAQDDDTTYTAGNALTLSGTTFNVDEGAINTSNLNNDAGFITEADDDDTTYTAGAGLTLSGTTFATAETVLFDTEIDTESEFENTLFSVVTPGENNDTADDLSDDTTDDLSEGTTNLYYTDSRVASYLNANNYLASGDNISELTNDAGYITEANDSVSGAELDGTFSANGFLRRTGTSTYSTVAGSLADDDLSDDQLSALANVAASTAASGQVLGYNGASWVPVTDENTEYAAGNALTLSGTTFNVDEAAIDTSNLNNDAGFLSAVDISDDTNLVAGAGLTLTDDTLASVLGADVQIGEVTFDPIEETELDSEAKLENQIGTALLSINDQIPETQLEGLISDVNDIFTNNDGALSDDDLSDNTTDDLAEGAVNLYYSDSRVANYLNTNNYLASGDNISELTNDAGYITGNETITLSGDATGSGTTSISVSLATSTVADNEIDYSAVTVSDFTNDAGYITDAQDDDTTYTAGTGLTLSGTMFNTDEAYFDSNYFSQGGNSFGALAVLGTNDAQELAFETANTEALRIDTGGNVGIGTAAPESKLDIRGNLMINPSGSQQGSLHVGSVSGFSDAFVIAGSDGDNLYSYYNPSDNVFQWDTFRVSDDRRIPMALQPQGGRVAIGTTNPATTLDVAGTTTANAFSVGGDTIADFTGANLSISGGVLNATDSGEVNDGTNLGTGAGWYGGKSGETLEFKSAVAGSNISISTSTSEITFNATDTNLSQNEVEAFIFDANNTGTLSSGTLDFNGLTYTGTLGIANTDLTAGSLLTLSGNTLNVGGNEADFESNFFSVVTPAENNDTADDLSDNTTDDLAEGTTNLYSQWQEAGSNIFYTGGNVGVGTNSPSATLAVSADGTTPRFRVGTATSGVYALEVDENDKVTVGTGNNNIFFNTAGGTKVGVGTSSPVTDFTVVGSSYFANPITVAGNGTSTVSDDLHVQGTLKVGQNSLLLSENSITTTAGGPFNLDVGDINLGQTAPDGTPGEVVISGPDASGADVDGADVVFNASQGTGNGLAGGFAFRTGSGGAGVAHNATTYYEGSFSTSYNFSHSVSGGTNRLLLVSIGLGSGISATSVTYGGQALTQLDTVSVPGSEGELEFWYLKNPPTGTAQVQVDTSATEDADIAASNYSNVNQSGTFGPVVKNTENGNFTAPSVQVTNDPGDRIVDIVGYGNGSRTPSAGQTKRWTGAAPFISDNAGSDKLAGSTNTTMSWQDTDGEWALMAVPLKPVSGTEPTQLADALRITSSGNTQINGDLSAPNYLANTFGSLENPSFGWQGASSGLFYDDANSEVQFVAGGNNSLSVETNGITVQGFSGVDAEEFNTGFVGTLLSEFHSPSGDNAFVAESDGPFAIETDRFDQQSSEGYDLFITQTGNVGIGTDSPASLLEVGGAAEINGALTVDNINLTPGTQGSIPFIADGNGLVGQDNANLFFDNTNNRLGIGTNSPATTLDVVGTATINDLAIGGNTISDFTGTNLSVSGGVLNAVDTNTDTFTGLTDTPGTYTASAIPYTNGAGDTLFFTSDFVFDGANFGIGTGNPSASLEIVADGTTPRFRVESATSGTYALEVDENDQATVGTGAGDIFLDTAGGTQVGIGTQTPGQTLDVVGAIRQSSAQNCELAANIDGDIICSGTSDENLKTNIASLNAASSLTKITQLDGKTFRYLEEARLGTAPQIGFIAQEVEQIFPELVGQSGGNKYVNYDKLTAVLAEAVQELDTKVTDLQSSQASSAEASQESETEDQDSDGDTGETTNDSDVASSSDQTDTVTSTPNKSSGEDATGQETSSDETDDGDQNMFASVGSWLSERGVQITDGIARFAKGFFDTVVTNRLVIDNTTAEAEAEVDPAAGSGEIATGATSTKVENNQVATTSQVIVTFTGPITGAYWVEKVDEAFTLRTEEEMTATTTFDYMIVGVKGGEQNQESESGNQEEVSEDSGSDSGRNDGMTPIDDGSEVDEGSEQENDEAGEGGEQEEVAEDENDETASSTESATPNQSSGEDATGQATSTDESSTETASSTNENTSTDGGAASSTKTVAEEGGEEDGSDEPADASTSTETVGNTPADESESNAAASSSNEANQ